MALSASGVVSPTFLPSPRAVLAAGLDMVRSGELLIGLLRYADVVRNVPRPLIDVSYTLGVRRGEVLRR